MRVFLDNVDPGSNSGPNSFGRKLMSALRSAGHQTVRSGDSPDIQLAFIMAGLTVAPIIQRLDGIYFSTHQDWNAMNVPIHETYSRASSVIFQSDFNRQLTEKFFGQHANCHIIHNGTDLSAIKKILPLQHSATDAFENVWCCASSWRPHKRLTQNIKYFQEHAGKNDCLVIAGKVNEPIQQDSRVMSVGDLTWEQLVSLYKRSKYFIHMAHTDHCPNVVVDARAAGCHIICSSSGGTQEIAGLNSTVIQEDPWDFEPFNLYQPPPLDFTRKSPGTYNSELDIASVALRYIAVMEGVRNVSKS